MADSSWTCENGHRNPSREVTRCLDCDAPSYAASGPLYPSRPPGTAAREARSAITTCWWVGGLLVVACAVVLALAWPGETVVCGELDDGCVAGDRSGSVFLTLLAALGLAAGQVLLLVALVAEGVRLGLRSLGMPRTDQG